jgi:formylglycine-generating enzyme required for sulfatase activity
MDNRIKVVVALVLIGVSFWLYQYFGTATIAVTSEPTGAQIIIDGRVRGITPLSRLELDSGSHRLEVAHSFYQTHVEGLSLDRGDHLVKHFVLQVGEGTLSLLSNPKGAWVEVDGVRLPDRTPTTLQIAAGEHTIVMGQAERRAVAQVHTLKAQQTLEVNFNLNIDPHGSLTIVTSPRNAKIEFIDKDLVYAPQMRLPIGEYTVRVSRSGYETQTFRYTVRYTDNRHEVKLARAFGGLTVTTSPADADVQVSYTEAGRTRSQPYSPDMQLPLGAVELRARAIGYRTAFRKLNLSSQGATVRFDLEAMQVQVGRVFADPLSVGGQGPELVVIPAGRFVMGNDNGPPSEQPAHSVLLSQPFAVSRFEVTIGDYLKYLQDRGLALHERLDPADTTHAVAYVSHADATDYADWLSAQTGQKYRLPSEAEWEYVARAGSQQTYFFGEDPEQLCTYANVSDAATGKVYRQWQTLSCDDQLVRPGPVGTYQPNKFGVYDIYGNVAEWVADCGMPEYTLASDDGTVAHTSGSCSSHGVRGGSWDSQPIEASSSYRFSASSANDDRGIRLLRVL